MNDHTQHDRARRAGLTDVPQLIPSVNSQPEKSVNSRESSLSVQSEACVTADRVHEIFFTPSRKTAAEREHFETGCRACSFRFRLIESGPFHPLLIDLVRFVKDRLPDEDAHEIRLHVEDCERCAQLVGSDCLKHAVDAAGLSDSEIDVHATKCTQLIYGSLAKSPASEPNSVQFATMEGVADITLVVVGRQVNVAVRPLAPERFPFGEMSLVACDRGYVLTTCAISRGADAESVYTGTTEIENASRLRFPSTLDVFVVPAPAAAPVPLRVKRHTGSLGIIWAAAAAAVAVAFGAIHVVANRPAPVAPEVAARPPAAGTALAPVPVERPQPEPANPPLPTPDRAAAAAPMQLVMRRRRQRDSTPASQERCNLVLEWVHRSRTAPPVGSSFAVRPIRVCALEFTRSVSTRSTARRPTPSRSLQSRATAAFQR